MKGGMEGSSSHAGVEARLSEAAERMSSSVISSSSEESEYRGMPWHWRGSA